MFFRSRPFTLVLSSAALALGFVASLPALARLGGADAARVVFHATGPGGLRIDGTTTQLSVAEKDDGVHVVVPLAGLDTKIELRNKHMRDKYLETDKHPNAELVVARSALKSVEGGAAAGDADGKMTIHGRERPVRFHYEAKKAGNRIQVNGTVRLDIRQFAIEEPSFMGAKVKPEVDVEAAFSVAEQ